MTARTTSLRRALTLTALRILEHVFGRFAAMVDRDKDDHG